MKHLLILAIGCASVTTLITATPARSQTSKSSCPPPYVWVDVKQLRLFKIDPRIIVDGKVKVANSPCVDYEQFIKDTSNMPPVTADEYDIVTCDFKTQHCTTTPADPKFLPPGTLPRRIPLNVDPLNPRSINPQSKRHSPSTPIKSLTSRATRRVN